ncbi:hypothetical protein ILUMI_21340 [Ignelater luminosus]|uniref:Uncharacterized protein n=1 Tax=Ignelater luminosus TaxID=2038154 RepID=A0A8K0CGL9_IGNLU|nr:hypothetical protein ILUMI_21340 [Ignelater luminosus]
MFILVEFPCFICPVGKPDRGGTTTESVLQKFRKTFSLRFQKKGSKDSCSAEVAEPFSEVLGEPSEEDSPQRVPSLSSTNNIDAKEENSEQKYSPLEPLMLLLQMVSGCGGAGGDSSESHDTDPPGDELDSPPAVRRRPAVHSGKTSRPHSDLLNQILIDKFKCTRPEQLRKFHVLGASDGVPREMENTKSVPQHTKD